MVFAIINYHKLKPHQKSISYIHIWLILGLNQANQSLQHTGL